jgi:hypothetical protein
MSTPELKEAIEYGRLLAAGGKVYSSDKRHFLTQKGMTLLCDAAEKSVHTSPNAREEALREALEKVDAMFEKASPRDAWDVLCKAGDIVGDALLSTSSGE